MITEFGRVFLFFIVGAIFTAGGLVTAWLVRPSRSYPNKLSTYECGEDPVGSTWVKFNIRFYVIALIFLIFEVETVFLFPWALAFQKTGMFALVEMLVFLGECPGIRELHHEARPSHRDQGKCSDPAA